MIVDLSIPRRKSPVCRGICGRFARCSTLRGPRWSLVGALRRTAPNVIEGDYRAEGYLKLPWNPRVPPYEGHIVWTIQPDDGSERAGLIVEQRQTWNISSAKRFARRLRRHDD